MTFARGEVVLYIEEPVRVLHVFGALNRGGAESRTMDLYSRIDRNKVRFDFMVHSEAQGVYEAEVKALGGHVYHVPRFRVVNFLSYLKAWRRFLQENRFDCIHIHMLNAAVPVLLVAKQKGISFRVCHSRSASEANLPRRVYSWLTRPFVRNLSTHRLAVSSEAGRFAFHREYQVVNNAIRAESYRYDPAKRREIRESLEIDNCFVLGHVGRFHMAKNHFFLLEFFAKVAWEIPQARLVLAGDGEIRGEIEAQIEKLGLSDKVILLGMRDDIPDLLQAFDLFVFPSLYEGLPGSALEAQAAGLPCLLSDAITPEVKAIDDLAEFLPIDQGVSPWVEAIRRRYDTPEERRDTLDEMRAAGFDIDGVAAWYERFYLGHRERSEA